MTLVQLPFVCSPLVFSKSSFLATAGPSEATGAVEPISTLRKALALCFLCLLDPSCVGAALIQYTLRLDEVKCCVDLIDVDAAAAVGFRAELPDRSERKEEFLFFIV